MKPKEVIELKKKQISRLANQQGATGESKICSIMENWIPRPRGTGIKLLQRVLLDNGINIKNSSFDAIAVPKGMKINFLDILDIKKAYSFMTFIEIKSASQTRVKDDFSGFFFALTESEISAFEQLGTKHKVALFNKNTGKILLTSISEILGRAKSTNWQLSVQL